MHISLFGKTMENLRNRVEMKLVRSWEADKIRRLVVSPSYARHEIFGNVEFHVARAFDLPLDLQLDAVGGVHQPRAAAVHRFVTHGAQIGQKPELIAGVEFFKSHVFGFVIILSRRSSWLLPHVLAFDAFVIQHVRRTLHGDVDFCDVRKDVFFLVPDACDKKLHEKQASLCLF